MKYLISYRQQRRRCHCGITKSDFWIDLGHHQRDHRFNHRHHWFDSGMPGMCYRTGSHSIGGCSGPCTSDTADHIDLLVIHQADSKTYCKKNAWGTQQPTLRYQRKVKAARETSIQSIEDTRKSKIKKSQAQKAWDWFSQVRFWCQESRRFEPHSWFYTVLGSKEKQLEKERQEHLAINVRNLKDQFDEVQKMADQSSDERQRLIVSA